MILATLSNELSEMMAIPWSRIVNETNKDPVFRNLKCAIHEGFINSYNDIYPYMRYKSSLYIGDDVIFYQDRVVIPTSLRPGVLKILHAAHQGVYAMERRAQAIVFWPGMSHDIKRVRAQCSDCNSNAPSQAQLPAEPVSVPSLPFEQVFSDFFAFGGHHYLIVGDRLSGWSEVYSTPSGTSYAGSKGLIRCLRSFFTTFGVPKEISSDGGPEFMAEATQYFFRRWDIRHRVSSAYLPRSNGRAEVAVKSAKRLLRSNVGPSGSLNNDNFLRAMLTLRNTPDTDCSASPAEIIFGRPLRDAFSFCNRSKSLFNPAIGSHWREAWAMKELALRRRFVRWSERHNERTKDLKPLRIGDRVFVQNQEGQHPRKWDRSGLIVDVLPHCKYRIKIDGSGRVTNRNRQFLRLFKTASPTIADAPVYAEEPNVTRRAVSSDVGERTDDPPPETTETSGDEHTFDVEEPTVGGDGSLSMGIESPTYDQPQNVAAAEEPEVHLKKPLAIRRLKTHIPDGVRGSDEPPKTRLRPRR